MYFIPVVLSLEKNDLKWVNMVTALDGDVDVLLFPTDTILRFTISFFYKLNILLLHLILLHYTIVIPLFHIITIYR